MVMVKEDMVKVKVDIVTVKVNLIVAKMETGQKWHLVGCLIPWSSLTLFIREVSANLIIWGGGQIGQFYLTQIAQ